MADDRGRPRPIERRPASSSRSIAATTGSAPTSSRRAASSAQARRDSRRSASSCRRRAVPARPRRRARELGRRQAADRRGRPPAALVRGRACSASATPPTRCRRSAASASTSRFRTRSPPPTSSPGRCAPGRSTTELARGAARRTLPMKATQRMQVGVQNNVLSPALKSKARPNPARVRLLNSSPLLRSMPARLLGLGVRPEYVRTPERTSSGNLPASIRSPCRAVCGRRHGPTRRNTSAACRNR